ncbi:MAG: signal peptidase I [Gammaproteobacteria bacterium RBG_16_51_14]|nr:MAG: signal peptidase I [Gammaproteobacteria bacterium RBG_16_51_14]
MNFDFAALLVFLTFASGLIWAIDAWFLAPRRISNATTRTTGSGEAGQNASHESVFVEYARSFFPIFLIVLILRSFLVEPFKIPSASMMPTLLIGDFILVNKYDYGIRLPVLNYKIIDRGTPERGDIVVFRYPEDPGIPFIKRIVGLPGDKVAYYDKTLYINSLPVSQILKGHYQGQGAGIMMNGVSLRLELLDDIEHEILIDPGRMSQRLETVVPEGHYFVLGDNRDNSKDSRFWGFVPDQNLVGRAFMIWMNWDRKNGGIDISRIGTMMK